MEMEIGKCHDLRHDISKSFLGILIFENFSSHKPSLMSKQNDFLYTNTKSFVAVVEFQK